MSSSTRTAVLEPEALQADDDPTRTWRSGLTTALAVTAPVLFTLSNVVMPGLHGSTASVVAHIPAVADRLLATKLASRLSGLLSQPAAAAPDLVGLTPRELEVITLVARAEQRRDRPHAVPGREDGA
jgi:hypothetical protein